MKERYKQFNNEIVQMEDKYLEFLGNVEKSFPRADISAETMMLRMYCGLRFSEGTTRAMKLFKLMGKPLINEIGKEHLINWLQGMIDDLKEA